MNSRLSAVLLGVAAGLALAVTTAGTVHAQKYGGTLKAMLRENWPSLSIHDEATISAVWPLMPAYSNLVLYDPKRPTEDAEHLEGELATSWSWNKDHTRLTFKLRHGVTWHDGVAFTSKDVKFTFDVLRGASDKRLKLNPRKAWYENVKDIEVNGDYEVTFILKRPQPGLLSLLASGYSPVYPAHVDPQDMRTKEVGTGPFMIKEVKPDQELVLVKNPHYFIKGRPYLDEIDFIVIKSRPSRFAALESGQLDISFPGENTVPMRDEVKAKAPKIKVYEVAQSVQDNILLNFTKPPFNDARLRRAVNLALDRKSMIQSVLQGGAVEGAANVPPPFGKWGIPAKDLVKFPGYGDVEQNRAEARKLLAEAGYGPDHPLEITVETRAIDIYIDTAVWVIDRLKQVGIVGHLEQFETGVWHPKLTRKEFTLATNLTGVGSDDPDANFYENYACGSSRNYSGYCNQDVMALIDKQSMETNTAKRLALVREIDGRLQEDGARPILAHRIDYMMMWPYVKGVVPHNSIYSYGRLTDAWLDK